MDGYTRSVETGEVYPDWWPWDVGGKMGLNEEK